MDNIEKVRKSLSKVFEGIKDGTLDVKSASEMNNAAGKIIKSLAVQLDYYSLRKERPDIKFLNSTD
jgi:hypothetical protein